jgi:hypothetical protein
MLCVCIIARYSVYLKWHKIRKLEYEFETIYSLGWHINVGLEILLAIACPLPWLYDFKYLEYNKQFDIDLEYSVNDLLLFVCLFRVFIFVRFILFINKYM